MAERILGVQFREEQADSRYPFADTASLLSDTGLTLPADLILDSILYPIGGTERLWMASVEITARGLVTLTFADRNDSALAWVTFNSNSFENPLILVDRHGRQAGVLVLDETRGAEFQGWPTGVHSFRTSDTELVASCVIPTPEIGLRGLRMEDGQILTGDVWLVGENGVVLTEENGDIRIDIVGEPLFKRKLCEDVGFNPPIHLQSLAGIRADAYGNFNFLVVDLTTGDTILRLEATEASQLTISAVGQLLQGAP